MKQILEDLSEHLGDIQKVEALSGGDINEVYSVMSDKGHFCVKSNSSDRYPNMFEMEAKGLKDLQELSNFTVPKVMAVFSKQGRAYLVMEFAKSGKKPSNFVQSFAECLYSLHQNSRPQFGYSSDNYIGSLPQKNPISDTWAEFYAECRLAYQAKMAFDQGLLSKKHLQALNTLYQELPSIFPKEAPSLLHGDLWGGNAMVDSNGHPCIYDPAVYYGHREMDLAMMALFGGFEEAIFNHYAHISDLDASWRNRIPICQIYPLLVHLNLFGLPYVKSLEKILTPFM